MIKQLVWASASAALLINSAGYAQSGGPSNDSFKAKDLYVACNLPPDPKSPDDTAELICDSFIRGLTDGLFMMKSFTDAQKAGCLPSDGALSIAEARAEFEAFFLKHQDMADNSAGLVAVAGIMLAHPC